MSENKSNKQVLNEMKIEYAVKQKKGLPFILIAPTMVKIISTGDKIKSAIPLSSIS